MINGGALVSGEPRVALVLGSSTGGIGCHVLSLVAGLSADRVKVTVYAPAATLEQFRFVDAGAQVRALEIPARPGVRDARAVGALRAALRREPVDLVHAHGLRAGLVSAFARPFAVPLVVTWHNLVLGRGMRSSLLRGGERLVARAATVTLGASEDLVARVVALGGHDVRLGAVAAPALGARRREPAEIREELNAVGRPLIVSVGRLHPQKGYDVLVEAAVRWRTLPGPPLVAIAGTGPSYRPLAGQILRDRAPVILLGHRDDVADLLAAADLAVVSSVWEARQLFTQEALTAGVPLVATRVGGIPGLVGDAALLIPPNNVDALDTAVRSLLTDSALRERYASAGQRQARSWPTERDTVDQVRALYTELTRRGDGAGDGQSAGGSAGRSGKYAVEREDRDGLADSDGLVRP